MGSIAYNSPDLFTSSYYNAYEKEITNQRVQAEVMKLMEEAKLKAEMQPYDIEHKQALANQANAQAEASRRDKTNLWQKAQAEMSERQAQLPIITAYSRSGQFDAMLADPSIPQSFKDSFSKLPKEAQQKWLDGYIGSAPIERNAGTVRAAELRAGSALGVEAMRQEVAKMKLHTSKLADKAHTMRIPRTESEAAIFLQFQAKAAEEAGDMEKARKLYEEASNMYKQSITKERARVDAGMQSRTDPEALQKGQLKPITPPKTQNPAEAALKPKTAAKASDF
jgi:hypothetical protein